MHLYIPRGRVFLTNRIHYYSPQRLTALHCRPEKTPLPVMWVWAPTVHKFKLSVEIILTHLEDEWL